VSQLLFGFLPDNGSYAAIRVIPLRNPTEYCRPTAVIFLRQRVILVPTLLAKLPAVPSGGFGKWCFGRMKLAKMKANKYEKAIELVGNSALTERIASEKGLRRAA
jgi:hypothetical protein